ncbi:MAG: hypothetical protein A2539_10560 [Elusimicrobia bacterium RIFOXYD2_FULL_34_15]|nr:MAG: hypothetical protein A2539_10560 [Elusimicrobia bacterium RIFOXYD2_FULL_34_15]
MKIKFIIILTIIAFSSSKILAEQTAILKETKKKEPSFSEEKGINNIYFHSFYEYSWIEQNSRHGNWTVYWNRIAYLKNNLQILYIDITQYDRFNIRDYTIDFGSYKKIKNGYLNGEFGSALDNINYIYKFKGLLEAEHKIIYNWFINLNTRYLHYISDVSGDVYVFFPALVYYFGNNYVTAGYGTSYTQFRGSAHYGTIKGNFAINKRLNLFLGASFGNRLFDIDLLKSNQQYGSIFFGDADIILNEKISLRIGGSYSNERPSFLKSSIDFSAKVKF